MDFFSNIALGLYTTLEPGNLFYCFLGTLLGTLIGVLPGIGPLATVAMLLPLTYALTPTTSLIMLAGIYYGAQYGGSTTAILVNLPGEANSAVTTLDGYQMARKGRAGPALAAAAISSFAAGTIVTLLIAAVAKPLTLIATSFGAAEYFALLVVGLVSSVAMASGSTLKALSMIVLGLLLGLTGTDINSGYARFTFGQVELLDGLGLVALAVGLFGIGEIMRNLEDSDTRQSIVPETGSLMPSRSDLKRIIAPTLRGTFIGSFLGVLPGGGAMLATFMSYNIEKKISPNSHEFGHGAIEGVAAPEAANNASAQASFIPMLTLGIPSNALMALMMGAMLIHGISPGPLVMTTNPALFWGLIASMWIGNVMLVILNLPLIGIWVSLLRLPYSILFPAIVIFCCIGVYSVNNSSMEVYQIAGAGLIGYFLVKIKCEPAPFLIGFILGPLIEVYLRRALIISDGDPSVFVTRPLSATFLAIAAIALVVVSLPSLSKKREEVFSEEE